uniref:(northern house mosquito) hypothetical protein n=1 Tax=Culex pipiens TaxID=7175 RepID=A0A8D8B003_CULPI
MAAALDLRLHFDRRERGCGRFLDAIVARTRSVESVRAVDRKAAEFHFSAVFFRHVHRIGLRRSKRTTCRRKWKINPLVLSMKMAIPGTVDLAIDDGARTGCPAFRHGRTEISGARNFTARHSLTRLELLHRLLVVCWRETQPQLPESLARIAADQRTWHVVGGVENCCVPSLAKWSDLHCSSTDPGSDGARELFSRTIVGLDCITFWH